MRIRITLVIFGGQNRLKNKPNIHCNICAVFSYFIKFKTFFFFFFRSLFPPWNYFFVLKRQFPNPDFFSHNLHFFISFNSEFMSFISKGGKSQNQIEEIYEIKKSKSAFFTLICGGNKFPQKTTGGLKMKMLS